MNDTFAYNIKAAVHNRAPLQSQRERERERERENRVYQLNHKSHTTGPYIKPHNGRIMAEATEKNNLIKPKTTTKEQKKNKQISNDCSLIQNQETDFFSQQDQQESM